MTDRKKQGSKKQVLGEPWRGKSVEPLEWGGIRFYFPFSPCLPELTDDMRERFRESIRGRRVRHPILVVIPPNSDVRIEAGRLVCGAPDDVVDVTGNALEQTTEPPPVLVIDGEVRLRMAVSQHIALDDIPVHHFEPLPDTVDKQFRDLLKNQEEQAQYDSLEPQAKARIRVIHDLWATEGCSRAGMSAAGREKLILLIDRMWEKMGWHRLSQRKMGSLVGCKKGQVRSARRSMGGDHTDVSASEDTLTHLQELKWSISSVRDRMVVTLDEMNYGEWDLTNEKVENHREVTDATIAYLDQQIGELQDRINDAIKRGYDHLVSGGMGGLSALMEVADTVVGMLDEDPDYSAEVDYKDLFGNKSSQTPSSAGSGNNSGKSGPTGPKSGNAQPASPNPKRGASTNNDSDADDDDDGGPVMNLATSRGAGTNWFTADVVKKAVKQLDKEDESAAA